MAKSDRPGGEGPLNEKHTKVRRMSNTSPYASGDIKHRPARGLIERAERALWGEASEQGLAERGERAAA